MSLKAIEPRVPGWAPERLLTALALAAVTAACGGGDGGTGPTPPAPQGPSLRLVSGAGSTDTIEALSTAPLVVEVRDANGQLRAGVNVRFDPFPSAPLPGCTGICFPVPQVAPNGALTVSPVTVATDANGRVSLPYRFGTSPGEGKLAVTVPELALQDTARFTILPGAAARVEVVPADTAVSVGGSFSPRGGVVDRRGNPRPDAVSFTAGSAALTVSGNVVSGVAAARSFVVAELAGQRDTGWVSVVPQGEIAVYRYGPPARLQRMKLDGTLVRSFDLPFSGAPDPDWSPDGQKLVGVTHGTAPRLAFYDLTDGTRTAIVDPAVGLRAESHPRYSRDGAWIYFNGAPATIGGFANVNGRGELWRVRPDGSGAARVGPVGALFSDDYSPSPSPDGTKVAFQSSRDEGGTGTTLRVLDLATGIESYPGGVRIIVEWLAWSPTDAQMIAFGIPDATPTARGLRIDAIRPDGTGRRTLSPAGRVYVHFTWSPDGKWLLAKPADRTGFELIEVATGQVIPLPFTGLESPVWRP